MDESKSLTTNRTKLLDEENSQNKNMKTFKQLHCHQRGKRTWLLNEP